MEIWHKERSGIFMKKILAQTIVILIKKEAYYPKYFVLLDILTRVYGGATIISYAKTKKLL